MRSKSRQEAATRASTWLRERIVELKQKLAEADLAVQQYRESNALITAGGPLINDQLLFLLLRHAAKGWKMHPRQWTAAKTPVRHHLRRQVLRGMLVKPP
jgi:hypothetical protein